MALVLHVCIGEGNTSIIVVIVIVKVVVVTMATLCHSCCMSVYVPPLLICTYVLLLFLCACGYVV